MSDFSTLEALYAFYDEFISGFPIACKKGCSVCCTTNVTVTSLEVEYLMKSAEMNEESIKRIEQERKKDHFIPSTTINTTAAMCLAENAIPEETSPITFNPCPLLTKEGLCSIYAHRPFACRAMSSETICVEGGEANMAPFLVTINLAIYQILEHIDSSGWYGNLLDMIPLARGGRKKVKETVNSLGGIVKTNRKLPCFIVPPDETIRFKSFIRRLAGRKSKDKTLGDLLPKDWQVIS